MHLCVLLVGICLIFFTAANASPLPQDAYIWQRAWNAEVRQGIHDHGKEFSTLVVLSAEVSWKNGRPDLVRIPVDFTVLHETKRPIGLALRIGPYPGPFDPSPPATKWLSNLAFTLLREARAANVQPAELQLDFDCAESKLAGYRVWVESIRKAIHPVPLVITTLPSWMANTNFPSLVRASDGYILQVHSLERPRTFDQPFQLCSPEAARRAVAKAASIGAPFRVALPTYGYLVAYAPDGRFIGISAEGPAKSWPPEARLREVSSNPFEIAGLVNEWQHSPPNAMRGIIWYRFPISLDTRNWTWPTLNAVKAGRLPREKCRVVVDQSKARLKEISLVNDGEADLSSRPVIEIRWQRARLVAGDGLRNFEVQNPGSNTLQFRIRKNLIPSRLAPGEREIVGWIRFDGEVEVQSEIKMP